MLFLFVFSAFIYFPFFTEGAPNQCCDVNQALNFDLTKDLKTMDSAQDICVNANFSSNTTHVDDTITDLESPFGLPNCTKRYILNNRNHLQFRITPEGKVEILVNYHFYKSLWLTVPQTKYCTGMFDSKFPKSAVLSQTDGKNHSSNSSIYDNDVLIICEFADFRTFKNSTVLYGFSRFISGLNLLVVLLIYITNWKSHNVIGWLTCCYILSLTCHCVWTGTLFLMPLDWFQPNGELEICQTSVQITRYLSLVLLYTAAQFNFFMFMTFWKMNYKLQSPGKDFEMVPKFFLASWLIPAFVFAVDYGVGRCFGQSHPWIYHSFSVTNHYSILPYTFVLRYWIVFCTFAAISLIIASGVVIMYLRTSSKVTKVSYSESLTLFVRLLLGSGFFMLCYALADYASRETESSMKWKYWNIAYCIIAVGNSFYVLIVFGLTGNNFSLFTQKVKSALRASKQFR